MKHAFKLLAQLNVKFKNLQENVSKTMDYHSFELILTVFFSTIISVLSTVSLFCLIFESPTRRNLRPPLFKKISRNASFSFSRAKTEPYGLEYTPNVTTIQTESSPNFEKTHKKQHSL